MYDEINNKLLNNIVKTNKIKSSHWEKYLPDSADYLNPFSPLGFGSYSKKNYKNYRTKHVTDKKSCNYLNSNAYTIKN